MVLMLQLILGASQVPVLFEASQDLNIDLGRSVLIGDRSDLQAGAGAGLAALVHVMTGHGRESQFSDKMESG